MKLTERDISILKFINDCGYCLTPHLMSYLSVKQWRIYQIMKRLVIKKLVVKEYLLHGKPLLYYLTKEGASFTDLPPLDNVSQGTYQHQVTMIDVILKLMSIYSDAVWISERHLLNDQCQDGIGKRGHVADGMLFLSDGKKIAIEVELSVKGKRRIEGILQSYASQSDIREVWYFCSKSAYAVLSKTINKPYIKLFSIEEFLA